MKYKESFYKLPLISGFICKLNDQTQQTFVLLILLFKIVFV